MAGDGLHQESSAAPLGGENTGKNPTTDRGKLGAKMNLLVDERGALPSRWCSPGPTAPRQDIRHRSEIVSMALKSVRPIRSSTCARIKPTTTPPTDGRKGVRRFRGLHRSHPKVNPRRRARRSDDENLGEKEGARQKKAHPARRWVVERTISWLTKRRGLRTRWSKKSDNWLALVQFACAHVLLNLAVFG